MGKRVKLLIVMMLLMIVSLSVEGKIFGKKKSPYAWEKLGKDAHQYNEQVLKAIERRIPNDHFFFTYGLREVKSTNGDKIYYGKVYSDKLEECGAPYAIGIRLDGDLTGLEGIEQDYRNLMVTAEATVPVYKMVREIFGDGVMVESQIKDFNIAERPNIMKGKYKAEGVKSGEYTYISVFVDNLYAIDEDDLKRKVLTLRKRLYYELNIESYVHLSLYNKKDLTFKKVIRKLNSNIVAKDIKMQDLLIKWRKDPNNPYALTDSERGYILKHINETFGYDIEHRDILCNSNAEDISGVKILGVQERGSHNSKY